MPDSEPTVVAPDMGSSSRLCIVLPAYNAAETVGPTLDRVPPSLRGCVILVDDTSTDATVDVARGMGIYVHQHERNRGYGANQKTCYLLALETDADVIVMLHPDNQYDGSLIPHMVGFLDADVVDIVLGSRIRRRGEVLAGGMPAIKYFANRALTLIENVVLGLNLPEYHTGFRAYHRRVLERLDFEAASDDFVFDQQLLMQARVHGLRVGSVPVPTHYGPESSSISFSHSARYSFATLALLGRYALYQAGWRSQPLFRRRGR